ncbi:MAG: serine/threonine-protein kinase [Myxococcales bacterium]
MPPLAQHSHRDATRRSHALVVGSLLNADLEVTGVLGEGGTAVVYSAFHTVLAREVAVKVCTVRGSHAIEAQMRLICEAKMCASIRDARIPRVYGLDRLDDGTLYMVMEKVEGEALSRTLARWQVPVRYACKALCNLLDTLENVHRAGLIHRDIKPSNLLVDLRPSARTPLHLIDFGIAKVSRASKNDPALTQNGALVGTPRYMAPEQIAGQVDTAADLYASGIVLYEMLAGRAPFEGKSAMEVIAAVLCDPIPPLVEQRPGLPERLYRVVDRATARAPRDRFKTASRMRAALLEALDDVIALGPRPEFEARPRLDDELDPSRSELDGMGTEDEATEERTLGARPMCLRGPTKVERATSAPR